MPDHEQKAAELRSGRAQFLVTAVLAIVAGQATIATFILGARKGVAPFFIVLAIAFACALLSATFGTLAQKDIARQGAAGTWDLTVGKRKMNLQGFFITAAVMITAFAPLIAYNTGRDRPGPLDNAINMQATAVSTLATAVTSIDSAFAKFENIQLATIQQQLGADAAKLHQLARVERELKALRHRVAHLDHKP